MDVRAVRWFVRGQWCLYGGILLCVLFQPAGLAADDGISYYGHFLRTIVPYVLALGGSGFCNWRGARLVTEPGLKVLRSTLLSIAALECLIILFPVTLSTTARVIHTIIGSLIFVLQFGLSGWLVHRSRFARWPVIYGLVQLLGGLGCYYWLLPSSGFLIQCQVVFQVGFTGVVWSALNLRAVAASGMHHSRPEIDSLKP